VVGELDLAVADQLREALDRAGTDRSQILIALGDCEFIDSTGIAVIVHADQQMAERGGWIAAYGPSSQVRRILSVTGLTENGLIFESAEDALAYRMRAAAGRSQATAT
jgi:anti-sigma B factor antagonist